MRGFYRSTALALPDPATATGTHLLHASWTLGGIRSSVVRPEGGAPGLGWEGESGGRGGRHGQGSQEESRTWGCLSRWTLQRRNHWQETKANPGLKPFQFKPIKATPIQPKPFRAETWSNLNHLKAQHNCSQPKPIQSKIWTVKSICNQTVS